MRHHRISAGFALLLAVFAPSMRADATLRYHADIQVAPGVGIPVAAVDQAFASMRDMVLRIKGDKSYSSQGNMISITDLKTQNMIMVDAANKRFATLPAGEFAQQSAAAIPALPEQARAALASMKTNFESRSTGRTATILGIAAEEHEYVLTLNMALPGVPSTGSPLMKLTMQVWTAQAGEEARVPALQEFQNYKASATSAMDPVQMMKQLVGLIPAMGESLGAMIAELGKNGNMTLRTHTEVVAPLLAMMSQQLPRPQGQAAPPALDPNAPLMQMTQELVELSSDPVDAVLFRVPDGYQPASLEEILKGAVSAAAPPVFKQ
jgi:hypothetical protein